MCDYVGLKPVLVVHNCIAINWAIIEATYLYILFGLLSNVSVSNINEMNIEILHVVEGELMKGSS